MKELNEKLAKWAGLKQIVTQEQDHYKRGIWADADGTTFDTPDFTTSLDACFKWLVPKVHEQGIDEIQFSLAPLKSRVFDLKNACALMSRFNWDEPKAWGDGETPALVLCRAIEKLIDSQNTE